MYCDVIDPNLAWPVRIPLVPLFWGMSGVTYLDVPFGYWLFSLFLLLLGAAFLLRQERRRIQLAAIALLGVVSLLNPLVTILLASFPLALFLVQRSGVILPLVGVTMWCLLSGPYACLGVLILIYQLRDDRFLLPLIGSVGILLSIVLQLPYPLLDYPSSARLLPTSKLMEFRQPLVGPALPLSPLLTSDAMRSMTFFRNGAVTAFACLLVLFPLFRNFRAHWEWRGSIALLLSVALLSEVELRYHGSFSGEIASIVPGLALVPLSSYLLASLILFGVCLGMRKLSAPLVLPLLLLSLIGGGRIPSGEEVSPERYFSARVNETYPGILPIADERTPNGVNVPLKLSSELRSEDLSFALDRNPRTRWSTGKAQQGGERIEVQLSGKCPLLKLDLGSFPHDFPRALRVKAVSLAGEVRVFEFPVWEGPLLETRGGARYFGNRSDVMIALGEEPLQRIELEQSGRDEYFYWSIAEISCER